MTLSSDDALADNMRFLRALVARPKNIGAILPSSRALARAIAGQIDPNRPGRVLELGPGTGVVTQALLERGIEPDRLTVVEYDPQMATSLAGRFPNVEVIEGDAFDLGKALGPDGDNFNAIISGIPLLNFPVADRCGYIEGLTRRIAPGGPLIQFSYGVFAPVKAPRGHSLERAALVWANLPPARVWVYRRA